jgi:hypothetical protein
MKNLIKSLWVKVPDNIKPVIHAFWETFLGVFLTGILGIISGLVHSHNFSAATSALVALIGSAIAMGFAAAKAMLLAYKNGKAA